MPPDDYSVQPTQHEAAKANQAAANQALQNEDIMRDESIEAFQNWIDEGVFNPTLMSRRFQALENGKSRKERRSGHSSQTTHRNQRAIPEEKP
jgi:hypothetical protein